MVLESFDLPDEHYTAIGKVASIWSVFETLLDVTIWTLTKIETDQGACLTAQIAGSARKLDAIISLLKLRPDGAGKIKPINKIAEATRGLAERRNRVVHDPWLHDEGKLFRLEATARKTLKFGSFAVDPSEIGKLQSDMLKHIYVYTELMRPYLLGFPTSPEMPDGA